MSKSSNGAALAAGRWQAARAARIQIGVGWVVLTAGRWQAARAAKAHALRWLPMTELTRESATNMSIRCTLRLWRRVVRAAMRARAAMVRAAVSEGKLSEGLGPRLEGGLEAETAEDGLGGWPRTAEVA